jgi:hypothetical protein
MSHITDEGSIDQERNRTCFQSQPVKHRNDKRRQCLPVYVLGCLQDNVSWASSVCIFYISLDQDIEAAMTKIITANWHPADSLGKQ